MSDNVQLACFLNQNHISIAIIFFSSYIHNSIYIIKMKSFEKKQFSSVYINNNNGQNKHKCLENVGHGYVLKLFFEIFNSKII